MKLKRPGLDSSFENLVAQAIRDSHQLSAMGEDDRQPYHEAIEQMQLAISVLTELRDHAHDWDEDYYCAICGADGGA